MNRFLEKLNLIGVIALAGLCVFQWRINRDVNTTVITLQKTRNEQSAKIADQEKIIAGQTADIESFRFQLVASKDEEKESRRKLDQAERATRQVTVETEQLKAGLTNWVAAVNERDQQLEKAATQIVELVKSRDDAIEKYNALAKTHNQLVADFNRSVTNATAKN